MPSPLARDLDFVLEQTGEVWRALDGATVFVTGGTGFFGCWLLESFAWAVQEAGLNAKVQVLTRSRSRFETRVPHLSAHPFFEFVEGDVRDFPSPLEACTHIIHGAAEAGTARAAADEEVVFDVNQRGTERVLSFGIECEASNFLLVSSGAVYGRQAEDMPQISESFAWSPDSLEAGWGYRKGKRAAEDTVRAFPGKSVIARPFTFLGPYMPLDGPFAAGNFLRDGLKEGLIRVGGDGTARRSYLYASDLTVWLWKLLISGRSGEAYNVGSEDEVSIAELARETARATGAKQVVIGKQPIEGASIDRYVPSTCKARSGLGLAQTVPLPEALDRTTAWILDSTREI